MKNLRYIALLSVIILLLVAFSSVSAQGSWTTGIDVQSLSGSDGTVVVEFFESDDGTSAGSLSDTITAFGGLNFYLPNEPSISPGQYSAIVSADVEVAATVSLANYSLGGADIYLGTGTPENTLNFPLVYRNHTSGKWNSELIIQNADASAQDVTLKLYTSGSSTPSETKTVNILGNASYTFKISDAEYNAFGPFGSGTVEGTKPLAGVAMSIRNPGSGAGNVIETSYRAFGSAQIGKNITMPLVYKNFNLWTTGINIVNTGGTDTDVEVEYTNANPSVSGGPFTDTLTISGNSMGVFYTPNDATIPDGFYGSAKITSDTHDVSIVVASQRYRSSGAEGVAYEGSLSSDASLCVSLPVVHNRSSWKTGINILNTEAGQATVTIDYNSSAAGIPDANGTYFVDGFSPLTVYMPSDAVTNSGFYGAAAVESDKTLLINVANSRADRGVASNYVGVNYTCPTP